MNSQFHTIIIGSGAAGLNCAVELVKRNIPSDQILIITEKLGGGTSFEAGSDKQTYYKLSLGGEIRDSPSKMAQTLFDGGSMHGDIALIEATCSVQAFMNLVNLGVSFPHDQYGTYVGYKTDNDPLQRGTSAGPLTSQQMGKLLLNEVRRRNIQILDKSLVVEIIKDQKGKVCGLIYLNLNKIESCDDLSKDIVNKSLNIIQSDFIILATGGPSGMYKYSVYPHSQWGSTSLAISAGAKLQNLTESQFGLASLKFRWNVSGSYQQVIPRYFSIAAEDDILDPNTEQREFLQEYFPTTEKLINAIFLKGYQWPFNVERIADYGSSLIDMAIHVERIERNRKVYMNFMQNPSGFDWEKLSVEAKEYLENSGAIQTIPIDRLSNMNPEAINLYKNNGIDLYTEPLEIGVCAQHCNGGISGDIWWETSVPHLFAIGEVNGSHGVHRPGGSALNSGQVGGIRVAEKIAYGKWKEFLTAEEFSVHAINTKSHLLSLLIKLFQNDEQSPESNQIYLLDKIQSRMMKSGAYTRNLIEINNILKISRNDLNRFFSKIHVNSGRELLGALKTLDALICQITYLMSIQTYIMHEGGSRGSFLIINKGDDQNASIYHPKLKKYPIKPRNFNLDDKILEIFNSRNVYGELKLETQWVKCRPIPKVNVWFEKIWAQYQDRKIFNKKY
ncbi:FAD-binding protein [Promethearchaeum syntrophicum]|uniref:FAD-binding protein n=1 Tax=Promethearchaeum syntrophicum TaxID=2594042 RepID=A0A5B9DEN3_9ARCH|nr:FAD-binding protein [Candidatus Prometheoarchaeum syntrophicum]QEE17485.1 L-aspartate oxidase [Candidatus Prometheoarchaeum syntrophicum]